SPPEHTIGPMLRAWGISFRRILIVSLVVPVGHPFNNITGPIHNSIWTLVGHKCPYTRRDLMAVLHSGPIRTMRLLIIPPWPEPSVRTSHSFLPFCFCREPLTSPSTV